jgi:curli biogenesis system outer membrane secretion channel CsgG
MSTLLLTAPGPEAPLPCAVAPAGAATASPAAKTGRRPVPRRKRPIASGSLKARASQPGPSQEEACRGVVASYYVGPLND